MKTLILKVFDSFNLFEWFNRFTANTATVFMLHSVRGASGEGGCLISPDRLKEFLTYLRKESYNVISLADYVRAIETRRSTYKTVVLTVDDGYRIFYRTCFPIFREFGYPATVFLITDFIEKRLFLWWDKVDYVLSSTLHDDIDLSEHGLRRFELGDNGQRYKAIDEITAYCKSIADHKRKALIDELVSKMEVDISDQPTGRYEPLRWQEIFEMSQHKIDFYPHTITHPILSHIPFEEKLAEIGGSKRFLERKLNRALDIFSYPNGKPEDIDPDTIRAVRESGFKVAVTSVPGFNSTQTDNDMLMLHRFAAPETMIPFKQYVSGLECAKSRVRGLWRARA